MFYTNDEINNGIKKMSYDIERYCKEHDIKDLHIMGISKACFPFMMELMKSLHTLCSEFDFIDAKSYVGTDQKDVVEIKYCSCDPSRLKDKYILLIDTVWDSGKTLSAVYDYLEGCMVTDVMYAILINKLRKKVPIIGRKFIAFECSADKFIVGYGLDYNQKYRNLINIYDYEEECFGE